jgi:hypothetical protein
MQQRERGPDIFFLLPIADPPCAVDMGVSAAEAFAALNYVYSIVFNQLILDFLH